MQLLKILYTKDKMITAKTALGRLIYMIGRPLIMLGLNPNRAYVILIDIKKEEVLLLKNILGSGGWSLPGGGLKRGENHLQAARREVQEEINLKLNLKNLKELCSLPAKNRFQSGKRVFYICPFNKKYKLKHNQKEILMTAWHSLYFTDDVKPDIQIVLKKAQAYFHKQRP